MRVKVNGEWVEIDLHPRYSQYGIWYNVRDYREDKLVRFYRRVTHNNGSGHKKGDFYELPIRIIDVTSHHRKSGRSPNMKPQLRRRLFFSHNGKQTGLYCSRLTYYIGWAFPDVSKNPVRMVVDHIDRNTLKDSPTNLFEWTQKENVNTPACNEARKRCCHIMTEYRLTKYLKKLRSNG